MIEKKYIIDDVLKNGPMDRALTENNPGSQNSFLDGVAPAVILAGILIGNLVMQDGFMQSGNFVTGSAGWKIGADGTAEFSDTTVRGTLVAENIYFTKQFVLSFFESLDGWAKSASGVTIRLGNCVMSTSATINTTRSLNNEILGSQNEIDWANKNPVFTTGLVFDDSTAQLIRFGMGEMSDGSPVDGLGFKNLDGTVSAMANNQGTETLVTLSGISIDEYHIYRVSLDSATQVASYYVDNVLRATISTNIPTGQQPVLMEFTIKNTEAVDKSMYISFASFQQDV